MLTNDALSTQKCHCPYCGERIELVIDLSISDQEYIEDCFVCCRPITVTVTVDDNEAYCYLRTENE